jgi:hypothetical protein
VYWYTPWQLTPRLLTSSMTLALGVYRVRGVAALQSVYSSTPSSSSLLIDDVCMGDPAQLDSNITKPKVDSHFISFLTK